MKLFNPLMALVLSLILFISCSKNEDSGGGSADVTGNFIGRVKYQSNSLEVDRDNRLMRVLRESDGIYKIEFFTGIPNITTIRFTKTNDSTWVSTDTMSKKVTISGKLLTINYQSDSQTWNVENAVRQ